jgi:hypothetical protein
MTIPLPDPYDKLAAIGPWVLRGDGGFRGDSPLKPRDFLQRYEGYPLVDQIIAQFESELPRWMVVKTPADLVSFRHGDFNLPAQEMAPIIAVTAPLLNGKCSTRIGDGRGRCNFAQAWGIRLHVYRLIHRDCYASAKRAGPTSISDR